ncbi:S1 family peptidase [Nocardia sp. NPDC048505]|uniref:S1 family peptidase n=1 Tax=unclassified Nocardia TaxID=2637762 RepID=UPI0033FDD405
MFAVARVRLPLMLAVLVVLPAAVLCAGRGVAVQPVVLGGGSGIVLGEQVACTLTTIGYDRARRLVGLTAGHCTEVGMVVRGERAAHDGAVGTVALVDYEDDYAVIEFDPDMVRPVRQVADTRIDGIGAPARAGDRVCKNGRTTGFDCGVVRDAHPWWFRNEAGSQSGDSGAPVTLGDQLVGMNVGHLRVETLTAAVGGPPGPDPAVATQIGMILADIEEIGGIGAGFRPV